MVMNMLKEPDLATFALLSSILIPSSNKIPKVAKGFEAFRSRPPEGGQILFVREPSHIAIPVEAPT